MSPPPEGAEAAGSQSARATAAVWSEPEVGDKERRHRTLTRQLETARTRRERLEKLGAPTDEVDREILNLRRELRAGGQLHEGDALGQGRYTLVRRLGKGGFATVWEAHDEIRKERVALKVLHPELARDESRLERFFRGAREMAELSHAAVVRVLEQHGEDDGWHYFVMEYVPGGDLRRAVLENRLRADDVLRIIDRVGSALVAAHAKGLVHRDVKPANILIDATGLPRLTDFDLVAAADTTGGTRTGAIGTFMYAAPELMNRPQEADARADLYGLGMTAIFCLHGDDLPVTAVRRPDQVIAALQCSEEIRQVLTKAIEERAADRYADTAAFCAALRRAAAVGTDMQTNVTAAGAAGTQVASIAKLWRPTRKGLLLGAGFSHDFGMPLLGELTEIFLAAFSPTETRRFTENLARSQPYSKDRPIDPTAVRAGMDVVLRYKREAGSDYEALLGQLESAPTRSQSERDSYSFLFATLSELVFMILSAYQAVSYQLMYPVNRPWFSGLRTFLSDDETWVFSLNHDLYVECLALDLGIPITYGEVGTITFPRSNLRLQDKVELSCCNRLQFQYDGPGWLRGTRGINLVRLHGGLAELEYNDGAVICNPSLRHANSSELMAEVRRVESMAYYRSDGARVGSSHNRDRAITGTDGSLDIISRPLRTGANKYMKTTKVRPGEERLKLFDDALRQLDELTIIGYGLGDEHVNSRVLNAMVLNPRLRIRIVDPIMRPCPPFLRQFDYDLRVLSSRCGAAEWISYVGDGKWDDVQMKALSENRPLRAEVRRRVERWPRR